MLSLQSLSWSSAKPLAINPRIPSIREIISTVCASNSILAANTDFYGFDDPSSSRSNYSTVKIDEKVELGGSGKLGLDSWIPCHINGISRVRVQSSVHPGLVSVNGHVINKKGETKLQKTGFLKKWMDSRLSRKVVHLAPVNTSGTLVNGILHHCRLSTVCFNSEALPDNDDSGDELSALSLDQVHSGSIGYGHPEASVRPGLLHRLDEGTSGLLVVAKEEHSHSYLTQQFNKHRIKRVSMGLTCGVPTPLSGHIDVPVGRDVNSRIRIDAIPGSATHGKACHAVSRLGKVNGRKKTMSFKLQSSQLIGASVHCLHITKGIPHVHHRLLHEGPDTIDELLERHLVKDEKRHLYDDESEFLTQQRLTSTRREALSLYRDIIRATRFFMWPDSRGILWRDILRENARKEFEEARFERDPEVITRLLIGGRDAVQAALDKLVEKQKQQIEKEKDGSNRR